MKYATVCSGIGAPEAAWSDMWGPPEFVSEIDKFPSAVLKHHYPDVPNYGDMTKYKEWPDHDLDVLIGGTPCQSFSVAGLRRSLEDERGNLTLTFLGLARRYQPRFTIWENVPGVLNTPDNAFGCLLAGLVGSDTIPVPNGDKGQGWGNSGFILGPERVAAWRVLDAQYFGVPQRRRRVFVIANPREMGFASCQILFEPESLRGNPPKGRKEGEGVAEDAEGCLGNNCTVASPITAGYCKGAGVNDGKKGSPQNLIVMAHGQGNAEIVSDGSPSLTCNHEAPILSIHARQDPISSDKALPLESKGGEQAIAFMAGQGAKAGSVAASDKISPTIRSAESGTNRTPCVAIQDGRGLNKNQNGLGIDEGGPSYTLDQTGGQAVAFTQNQVGDVLTGDVMPSMGTNQNASGRNTPKVNINSIVRRLTPVECCRLQGFPDYYTRIPWRGKSASECPDGPQYKALGNSMAGPVVKWIGRRIQLWEDIHG